MTTVYRAYSPSRGESTSAQEDHSYVQGVVSTRNQLAAAYPDQQADWVVQAGTVEWETP